MTQIKVHLPQQKAVVTHKAPAVGYAAEKAKLEGRNQSVTRPIPRLGSDIIPRKGGPKRKMTPQRMLNAINRFFAHCEEHDEMPTISGMMIHMGMYREDFYRYAKDQVFSDMMEQARLIVKHWAEMDVYMSRGMAAGKIAYMKNVHGWAEKLDTNNKTEVKSISVEEARSRIEMLAPLLLNVLKSDTTVRQMAPPVEEAEIVEDDQDNN